MLSDSIKREIAIALRKEEDDLTEREVVLLWRYTADIPMDVLLGMYPV